MLNGYKVIDPPLCVSALSVIRLLVPDEGKESKGTMKKMIVLKNANLKPERYNHDEVLRCLRNEIRVLEKLKSLPDHSEFIELVCSSMDVSDVSIVPAAAPWLCVEYCKDFEDLFDYMSKSENRLSQPESKMPMWVERRHEVVSQDFVLIYEAARRLINAVKRLHAQGIAHRDIKSENVLINAKTGEIKLIDFGCAYQSGLATTTYSEAKIDNGGSKHGNGTLNHNPPEFFKMHDEYDTPDGLKPPGESEDERAKYFQCMVERDAWSLGTTLLTMMIELDIYQAPSFRRVIRSQIVNIKDVPTTDEYKMIWNLGLPIITEWCKMHHRATSKTPLGLPMHLIFGDSKRAMERKMVEPKLFDNLVTVIRQMLALNPKERRIDSLPEATVSVTSTSPTTLK
jgi:serine/threonine protein kinase